MHLVVAFLKVDQIQEHCVFLDILLLIILQEPGNVVSK